MHNLVSLTVEIAMKWGLGACTPRRGRRRSKKGSLGQPAGSGELVQLGVPSVLPYQRCLAALLLASLSVQPGSEETVVQSDRAELH